MPFSRDAIKRLQETYRAEYGSELSDEEAWAMAHRLVTLFDILTRPPGSAGPASLP